MPVIILVALKVIFIAYLYLFVWQIAKAVLASVGTGRSPTRARPGAGLTVVRSETRAGESVEVRDSVVIGRDEGADLMVDDAYASEFHARVTNQSGSLSLLDLGSTNGTYVNGRRVTSPQELNRGDSVQIGTTVLEVT